MIVWGRWKGNQLANPSPLRGEDGRGVLTLKAISCGLNARPVNPSPCPSLQGRGNLRSLDSPLQADNIVDIQVRTRLESRRQGAIDDVKPS